MAVNLLKLHTILKRFQAVKGQKRYKAGIYARLSVDVDEKNESINVQIGIAEKFVKEFNQKNKEAIDIVGHYCDLGKTGSNFNRDGFNRLLQDIRLGDIDCSGYGGQSP